MSTDVNAGIPGIPLGALDAITDENTRQVLQTVVDGLNVRNGFSGTRDNRFITAELDRLAASGSLNLLIPQRGPAKGSGQLPGGTALDPGEISRAVRPAYAGV